MERRTFEFLYAELCVTLGCRVPRYDVWLRVWESGGDPEALDERRLRSFLATGLDAILREEGATLTPARRRRLERRLLAFDARHPTPEEWIAREQISADAPGLA